MICDIARATLSAHLDHEASEEEAAGALAHVRACDRCSTWWVSTTSINRLLRVRPAERVPDLAGAVLARAHPVAPGRWGWVRWALASVALVELSLALPGLIAGHGAASIHDARHVGSFGTAIAIGLLYVAWRPARAFGILPIVAALALTMGVAAVVDVTQGRTTGLAEAHHLLEVAGLALVWTLAGRPLPRSMRRLCASAGPPLTAH